LYEEVSDGRDFENLCEEVASEVTMHSELVQVLKQVGEQRHVGAIVITCGLRHI